MSLSEEINLRIAKLLEDKDLLMCDYLNNKINFDEFNSRSSFIAGMISAYEMVLIFSKHCSE